MPLHEPQEFFWDKPADATFISARSGGEHQMSDATLARNAAWYVRLRWIAIVLLALYYGGCLILSRNSFFSGIRNQGAWPIFLALSLACANAAFFAAAQNINLKKIFPPVAQLWSQIAVDLAGIIVVVHFCGSVGTPAPFLYVLHIALACIFFSTKTSIFVPIVASLLYCGCAGLEFLGLLAPQSLFTAIGVIPVKYSSAEPTLILYVAAVVVIFFLLWYMVSRLSKIIRVRERQLIAANEETRRTQREKEKYSIQMTHQLKSPLDAIRSNISLLLYYKQHKRQELPVEALELLHRIDIRAKGMTNLIVDVLNLSRLNTPLEKAICQPVEISALVNETVDAMKAGADNRGISIETDNENVTIVGIADHFKMLVENLIANAIIYSYDGGVVRVSCRKDPFTGQATLSVADKGIGIPEDKMPHMFDEYFRTKEAITHNSASTGIGLAIVKKVAQTYGVRLVVDSRLTQGTIVSAVFPAQATALADFKNENSTDTAHVFPRPL
jgi:two-component system phosphate regulon sensor histidine kinase PhoR